MLADCIGETSLYPPATTDSTWRHELITPVETKSNVTARFGNYSGSRREARADPRAYTLLCSDRHIVQSNTVARIRLVKRLGVGDIR